MSQQDRSGGRPGPRRGGRSGSPGKGRSGGDRNRGPTPVENRGGQRLTPKSPRKPEPAIAEGVTGKELDRSVWTQLRTLSKENAEGVAQHLVMVALLLDTDLDGAQAHAETAVRRAGRVPAAREALGLVAYRQGDGIALEPQLYPDTPNHPEWPSAALGPGEHYRSCLEWRFAAPSPT